ncbi:MAG: hypothetical protein WCK96_05785 [Methylococcales bacterium]
MINESLDNLSRWVNIILNESSGQSKRKHFYECLRILYDFACKEGDKDIFEISKRQLNVIIKEEANNKCINAANLCIVAMFVLENSEANHFSCENDFSNGFINICKTSFLPLYLVLKLMTHTMFFYIEEQKVANWYNEYLAADMIALSRGHTLVNSSQFIKNIKTLQDKISYCQSLEKR